MAEFIFILSGNCNFYRRTLLIIISSTKFGILVETETATSSLIMINLTQSATHTLFYNYAFKLRYLDQFGSIL